MKLAVSTAQLLVQSSDTGGFRIKSEHDAFKSMDTRCSGIKSMFHTTSCVQTRFVRVKTVFRTDPLKIHRSVV